MSCRLSIPVSLTVIAVLVSLPVLGAPASVGKVAGSFVVAGADAQLKYVRATRVALDAKGKQGYAVLLSARQATGDISQWRIAEPSERGSFIYVQFETNGAVWVADLGHSKAKSGRFSVVTELQKVAFEVRDQRLVAHIRTDGEQTFTEDSYRVDLTFEATLEAP